ncbi:hypothetical protein Poli38472_008411 [Pythium oligandrum]|uniref:Uncharacterized protein n=1 Tax=Pythium oligandrum TaxID=41045 RepID=A0A8K1CLL0_PYTOL|nr:hypothetical protein Poli38472_008411 [Pythium oligandrum]|eukprot:TMW65769.1 hypothetical protein Poli38472_008411 [Pythium oligandrum]
MEQLEIVPTYVAQLDGKILPNAHAEVDVDGDDLIDIIFGSMGGVVTVFKITPSDRLIKWKEHRVDGCVTSIYADTNEGNDTRIFVATAEGSCYVFQTTDSGDEFRPASEFRMALNVSDVLVYHGFLLFGTRDGSILMYEPDQNAFGGYKQVQTYDLGDEIESFLLYPNRSGGRSSRLLVLCASGAIFTFHPGDSETEPSAYAWSGPVLTPSAKTTTQFVIGGIRAASISDAVACGSVTGRIDVFSAGAERLWSYKIPEAVVALDRLSISKDEDVIIACTWSGELIAVLNPDRIVRFRMFLPTSSMFCTNLTTRSEGDRPVERALVGVSTSGVISIYRAIEGALAHALTAKTILDVVQEHAIGEQMDDEDKRRALLQQARERISEPISPAIAAILNKETPTVQDLVRLATLRAW